MDSNQLSDAQALWDDVISLATQRIDTPSIKAMLGSCSAVSLDEGTLTITTTAKFVKNNLESVRDTLCACASEAAFQPIDVTINLGGAQQTPTQTQTPITPVITQPTPQTDATRMTASFSNTITPEEYASLRQESPKAQATAEANQVEAEQEYKPIEISENDSKLTFDTFIRGEENEFAYDAARRVADGFGNAGNPLFIHGRPGLGKTHLLKAIQNYIIFNDPSRRCLYESSTDFISDYTSTMQQGTTKAQRDALADTYRNVDVLIIDDIQLMQKAQSTLNFFFDTFNFLRDNGKQIVIAADMPPVSLGLDERYTSRLDSGVTLSIQAPNYELKYTLLKTFYKEFQEEGGLGCEGILSDENLKVMAERGVGNIRQLRTFCSACMLGAYRCQSKDQEFGTAEILAEAKNRWPIDQKVVSVEDIQHLVEQNYSISHNDIIGEKRSSDIKVPRHIAIWLSHELTDLTLAAIGKKFGGRTHATVKHSIKWVDDRKDDRILMDRIGRLRDRLAE